MPTIYDLKSADPELLSKATGLARAFAQQYLIDDVVGVAFLGAIARGYFDASSDIDVAVFKRRGSEIPFAGQYQHVDGIEIHCHLADYEDEAAAEWNMAKRWTFAEAQVFFDPQEKVAALLADKVPLRADERKWLLMSGLALSEWYIQRLSQLWVERGSVTSAHQMIARGLDYFFDMLFALNGQLVADTKWKYYCAEKLAWLPAGFSEGVKQTVLLEDFSLEELERRTAAFMTMWREMLPVVEAELGMSYAEMMEIV